MFLRLRWFVLGALAMAAAGTWLIVKAAEARRRLTPRAVGSTIGELGARHLRQRAAALRDEVGSDA